MIHFAIYILLVAVILTIGICITTAKVKKLQRKIDEQHLMLTIDSIRFDMIDRTIKEAINNGN